MVPQMDLKFILVTISLGPCNWGFQRLGCCSDNEEDNSKEHGKSNDNWHRYLYMGRGMCVLDRGFS